MELPGPSVYNRYCHYEHLKKEVRPFNFVKITSLNFKDGGKVPQPAVAGYCRNRKKGVTMSENESELIFENDPELLQFDRDKLEQAVKMVDKLRVQADHDDGVQLFVARKGKVLLDLALGEAALGIPLGVDSVMHWFSATKPLISVAIAQLYERGTLDIEDTVQKYIPEFGAGKEAATIKQVLMHTGGFPMVSHWGIIKKEWNEIIDEICQAPAEWQPGTAAGYHPFSGCYILSEIVRRLDGRPIEIYVKEEIFEPLGMNDSYLGLSDEQAEAYGDRLSYYGNYQVQKMIDWNSPTVRRAVIPGGGALGSAHDLGRFYMALLNGGELDGHRILKKKTIDLFTTNHRKDMRDRFLLEAAPDVKLYPNWALGFINGQGWFEGATKEGLGVELVLGMDFGLKSTINCYGHRGSGCVTSWGDPDQELAMVVIWNTGYDPVRNFPRLASVSDSIRNAII